MGNLTHVYSKKPVTLIEIMILSNGRDGAVCYRRYTLQTRDLILVRLQQSVGMQLTEVKEVVC